MYWVRHLDNIMINFKNWFSENDFYLETQNIVSSITSYFQNHFDILNESSDATRYSVEVNYRTKTDDVLNSFAKITLGYISAALKRHGFHTKHVFDQKPFRLLVTSRNWDDGTWVGAVTWNEKNKCFVISKGFYNKMRKSISIDSSEKCHGDSAADISKQLHNVMHNLKDKPDRHQEKLKPVPLKRGPKK